MTFCSQSRGARVLLAAGLLSLTASGQSSQVPMADQVFKNVQVLKGLSVSEFMDTMGFFSASLGLNCVHCHVDGSLTHWEKFAEDVPRKRIARQMVQMVNAINKAQFGGRRVLTCNTCHRGSFRPEPVPSLAMQYGLPVEDPNAVEIVADAPPGPSADAILDRYLQAIGGASRVDALTSFTGKGSYEGYDSYEQQVPFEIFAKSPLQRTTVAHTQNGDSTVTYNGQNGWVASVDKPLTLVAMNRAELDAAKLDAALDFPSHLKAAFTNWKVGFPFTTIDDKEAQIVQGNGEGGTRVKLYFDTQSGLLVRIVRYSETIVGIVPTQIDYSDYREVAGVKMPFRWTVTWTDGRSMIELIDINVNVPVDPSKFSQPSAAVVKSAVQN